MKAPTRLTALLGLVSVAIAIAAIGVFLMDSMGLTSHTKKTPLDNIGGPFTLVDQNGKTVTEADFSGRYMLVYFGYTSCPDVCPTALNIMSDALEKLGSDQEKVVPVFISIDPERDTPDKMKEYVAQFNPRLVGLTGTTEQIAAVTKAYKVYAAKLQVEGSAKDDYSMDHSSFIFFIGPDSKYRAVFGNGTTPGKMAERMRDFL